VRDVLNCSAACPRAKLVLENGAGLSRIERISADALNQMLRAALPQPAVCRIRWRCRLSPSTAH